MTLENTVLEKLADWRPAAGRHQLFIPDTGAGWTVTLTTDRCDELGCLLWELALQRTNTTPEQVNLHGWAERVAARATGLLETLKVLEIDTERQEALLRSAVPTIRGERRLYYDVVLKNTTEALFRRFQGTSTVGAARTQVAFAMTHEALARLVQDLTADE